MNINDHLLSPASQKIIKTKRIFRIRNAILISTITMLFMPGVANAESSNLKIPINTIIKTLADQADQTICSHEVNSLLISKATSDVNIGNYRAAEAAYLGAAEGLAVCVDQGNNTTRSEGNSIGILLAFSTELASASNTVIPETYTLAGYAKKLLTVYPSKSALTQIKKMKEAGFFGPPKAPSVSHTAVVALSAEQVVQQFNGNSFVFNHKYNDKTLKVHGTLSQILTGHKGGALIDLDGDPSKNKNNRGFNDYVYCKVTKSNINSIMTIEKGETITIEGVYDYKLLHKLYGKYPLMPIELLSCNVVK